MAPNINNWGARDTTTMMRDRAQMQMRLGSLVIFFLFIYCSNIYFKYGHHHHDKDYE